MPAPCHTIASACFGFAASVASQAFIPRARASLLPANPEKKSSRTFMSNRSCANSAAVMNPAESEILESIEPPGFEDNAGSMRGYRIPDESPENLDDRSAAPPLQRRAQTAAHR